MSYKRFHRLITSVGLLIAAALIYMTTEFWLIVLVLLVVDMVLCWQWFVATHSSENELPCSSVCCCYFLGEDEEQKV